MVDLTDFDKFRGRLMTLKGFMSFMSSRCILMGNKNENNFYFELYFSLKINLLFLKLKKNSLFCKFLNLIQYT